MSLRGPKHLRVFESPLGVPGHVTFPQKLFKRFETKICFVAALAGSGHQFGVRGNDLYQPMVNIGTNSSVTTMYGGTASQPRGFDQWMTYYGSYYVYAASLKIEATGYGTVTDSHKRKVGAWVAADNTVRSRFEADERGLCNKWYTIDPASAAGRQAAIFTRSAHTTDVLHSQNVEDIAGNATSSPSSYWMFQIRDEDIALSATSVCCQYDLTLTQWARLWNPIGVAASTV